MTEDHRQIIEQIRQLPGLSRPDDVWNEVSKAVSARRRKRFVQFSIAASVVAVTLSLMLLQDMSESEGPLSPVIQTVEISPDRLNALMARSRYLEREIRLTPRMVRIESPTQLILNAEINLIDADINHMPTADDLRREALWQRRVNLMEGYWQLQQQRDLSAFRRVTY